MPATYVHLSGRDIDTAVFNIYAGNDEEPKVEVKPSANKICPRCRQVNGVKLLHCGRCGASLDLSTDLTQDDDIEIIRALVKKLKKNPKLFEQVLEM